MTFVKRNWLLIVIAIVGLSTYLYYFQSIFSIDSIDAQLSRSEIKQIADKYLETRNYDPHRFRDVLTLEQNMPVIRYLQRTFGLQKANALLKNKNETINYWLIKYYQDLPVNEPQHGFRISISPVGRIIGYSLILPDTAKGDNISQEEARKKCQDFLKIQMETDLSVFVLENSSSKSLKNRTDHYFSWIGKEPEFKGAKIEIKMSVKGQEIGDYSRLIEIPDVELKKYQQSETRLSFFAIFSFIFSFLILIFITIIFLKKYHQGEIGVRHGVIFFLLLITIGILQTLLNAEVWSQGVQVGVMARSQVTLFLIFVIIIFVDLFKALTASTGWAVGESYAREYWPDKLTSLDGILNGKIFTLNSAKSIVAGYLVACVILGFVTMFMLISIQFFNGWTTISHSLGSLDKPYIFLVPIISSLIIGIAYEITYRLFFITYLQRILKSVVFAVILSSLIYMIQSQNVYLYPISLSMACNFGVGLLLGYFFIKYDVLTVIIASSVTAMVLTGLSLFHLDDISYKVNASLVLLFLLAPLVVAVIGFARRMSFHYKGDELPPHIRRISERARMTKELEIARKVQLSLLPRTDPAIPGFEIASICVPAQEVGGDYYDFVSLDNNKIGIAIGDVSGKGVPAAIYMTLTKGILQSYAEENISPQQVLCKVNKLIYHSIERDSFVSMFYAILDIKEHSLTYARAGHHPAILFKADEGTFNFLEPDGIGIGLEPGVIFAQTLKEETLILKKNDVLIFYTDGFTEAMNSRQCEYGEDRLLKMLKKNNHTSAADLIRLILTDIKHFLKGYPQHDDMTMVAIKVI